MSWSRIRFIQEGDHTVAHGYYSSQAARQLEIVGFTYDPGTSLHRLPGVTEIDHYNRLRAVGYLLRSNGITDVDYQPGQPGQRGIDDLLAAARRARTPRDLAVLGTFLFDHPDHPAHLLENLITVFTERLKALNPPDLDPHVLDALTDITERAVTLGVQLNTITGQLSQLDDPRPTNDDVPAPSIQPRATSTPPPTPPSSPSHSTPPPPSR